MCICMYLFFVFLDLDASFNAYNVMYLIPVPVSRPFCKMHHVFVFVSVFVFSFVCVFVFILCVSRFGCSIQCI